MAVQQGQRSYGSASTFAASWGASSSLLLFGLALGGWFLSAPMVRAADPEAPADLTITNEVAAPAPQPFGLNLLVGPSGFNNVDRSAVLGSMEPQFIRAKFFVTGVGQDGGKDFFTANNLSSSNTYQDGFWDGAAVRVYRRTGPGPFQRVQVDTVSAFQAGRDFWAINFWPNYRNSRGMVSNDSLIPATEQKTYEFTDGRLCQWYQQTDLRNGKAVYYVVRAIGKDGTESGDSNVAHATPLATINNGPKINKPVLNAVEKTAEGSFKPYQDMLEATGGTAPLKWELAPGEKLPEGLSASTSTANGRVQMVIKGQPTSAAKASFKVRVTDSANPARSDEREIFMNLPFLPAQPKETASKPNPPKNVTAVANNGSVTLKWEPSDTADVVGYRVYRSYFPPEQQTARVVLAGGAGKIQKGDLVFMDVEKADIPAAQLHDRVLFTRFERDPFRTQTMKPGDKGWTDWKSLPSLDEIPEISIKHVPHPQPVPAEFTNPGKTCLELKAAKDWGIKLTIVIHGSKEQEWYKVLIPGHTYRFEAWMRQDGIPGGQVRFEDAILKDIGQTFTVDGTWKKYVYDFKVQDWIPAKQLNFMNLSFQGGGTLWLDRPLIYDASETIKPGQPDVPALGMLPMWKEELKKYYTKNTAGPRGVLRYWGGQSNGPGGTTLEEVLAPLPARRSTGSDDANINLPDFLTLAKEVNAEPWLTISSSWSEEEWRNLVEYLGGAPDSEYGKRRVADRSGVKTPWTEEFGKIHIECDNETWNSMFAWSFPGDKEKKIDRAEQYGAYAEMLFEGAKSAPAWKAGKLDDKIDFIVGGWAIQTKPEGYGHLAIQHAPAARFSGTAPYLGGWEQGMYLGGKTFNDEGVAQWLLYMPRKHQAETDGHMATRDQLRKEGKADYTMVVYEGGPGYDLPGPSNPSGTVAESYGKSLAAAVTTLDCYLYEALKGYGPQAFFGFRPGTRWSSHTLAVEGKDWVLRPQTTFLALEMRNLAASGPMVTVKANSLPTMDAPAYGKSFKAMKDVPLLGYYAFRDQNQCCVMLLSRKLDQRDPAGKVSNPGITPVTLHLPFPTAKSITLYKLAGDPRQSNVAGLPTYNAKNFAIEKQVIDAKLLTNGTLVANAAAGGVSEGGKEGLPAGSVYMYVIEEGK